MYCPGEWSTLTLLRMNIYQCVVQAAQLTSNATFQPLDSVAITGKMRPSILYLDQSLFTAQMTQLMSLITFDTRDLWQHSRPTQNSAAIVETTQGPLCSYVVHTMHLPVDLYLQRELPRWLYIRWFMVLATVTTFVNRAPSQQFPLPTEIDQFNTIDVRS